MSLLCIIQLSKRIINNQKLLQMRQTRTHGIIFNIADSEKSPFVCNLSQIPNGWHCPKGYDFVSEDLANDSFRKMYIGHSY